MSEQLGEELWPVVSAFIERGGDEWSAAALFSKLQAMGGYEVRSWCFIGDRIRLGQERYGELDLWEDERDWEMERAEELADSEVYNAYRAIAVAVRGRKAPMRFVRRGDGSPPPVVEPGESKPGRFWRAFFHETHTYPPPPPRRPLPPDFGERGDG